MTQVSGDIAAIAAGRDEQETWLRDHGWIQAPNETWGYPNSTCRSMRTEAAYHLGHIIVEIDDGE